MTEYVHEYEDEDGDVHTTRVMAEIISKENGNAREVEIRGRSGGFMVSNGNVLTATDRPGVYDVQSLKEWETTGWVEAAEFVPSPVE